MGKSLFLAHIRSLQINLRQVLEETKASKLGTVIGHKLYPEFMDVKQELTKRGYPTHSVDIFLQVCREMVDMHKAKIGDSTTPKVEPHMTPRAKLMEVIKKWESDGVFGGDAIGEDSEPQKCEGSNGREPEMLMVGQGKLVVSTKGDKLGGAKRTEVRNEKPSKNKRTQEDEKEDDSVKKGMKRKATEQSQTIAVNHTEGVAVSENAAPKRLKCRASSREASEKLVLERAGRDEGLKEEGGELATFRHLQEENAALRAQVDVLIQRLETRDQQITELLNARKVFGLEERRGNEEQEVIGLVFDEIELVA